MFDLSAKWAPILKAQPEAGMGWQVATVHLKDGRSFRRVVIVGATVASIEDRKEIPFRDEDIREIVVTNDAAWRNDGTQLPWWFLLIPEQLLLAVVAILIAPGVYAIYLIRHYSVLVGVTALIAWGLLFALLLQVAHRRRVARLGLTVPATAVVLGVATWLIV